MRTKTSVLAGLVALLVAAAVVVAWQVDRPHHSHRNVMASAPVSTPYPVAVSIAGDNPAPVGATLYIRVSATSTHPLTTVSLYDGARLVGSVRPGGGLAAATFFVPVADPGIHSYVGHVTDSTGVTASSPPAPVVAAVPRGRRTVDFAALPGETLAQAEQRIGLPATVLGPHTPAAAVDPRPVQRLVQPSPTGPLPTGTLLTVTVPKPPTYALAPATSSLAAGMTRADPLAMTAAVHNCTVVLTTSSSDELEVQHAQSTTGQFAYVGEVTAGRPLAVPDLPAGQQLLEARKGDTLGPVVQATVPDSCDQGTWSGDVQLRHGMLILPHPVDRVYLYLSINSQQFQRVPADDGSYLSSGAGITPVGTGLPDLDGQKLVVQAWAPPPDPLHQASLIGRGELDLPAGANVNGTVGAPDTLKLTADSPPQATSVYLAHDRLIPFTATTNNAAADRVQWQVLLHPLSTANHDAAPMGLLWSGVTAVHHGTGLFSLNSKAIPQLPADADSSLMFVVAHGGIGASSVPVGSTSSMPPDQWNALLNTLTSAPDREVYVRVLAYAGNTSLGIVSNYLKLTLPQQTSVNGQHIRLRISKVVTRFPAPPDPSLTGCVRVLTTPWTGTVTYLGDRPPGLPADFPAADIPAADRMGWHYPRPGTYCPAPQDDDCNFFCWVGSVITAVVDVVAKVWDMIASVYNGVIDFVESAIAAINPICLAAKAVSSAAGKSCRDLTKAAASAVITAVLSSYGLPASLPTSPEFAAVLEGDLTGLAVEYMKDLGIPCDELKSSPAVAGLIGKAAGALDVKAPATAPDGTYDVCSQLAGELLSSAKDQIFQDSQSQFASADGLAYEAVPGFVLEPEPRGQMQPLHVAVYAVGNYPRNHNYQCHFQVHMTDPRVNFASLFDSTFGLVTSAKAKPTGHGPWFGAAEAAPDKATLSTNPYTGQGAPISFTLIPNSFCLASNSITIRGGLGSGVVTTYPT